MADTEKITINLSVVDLGKIDLLVHEGFYSNRTDFMRAAARRQLDMHAEEVGKSVSRNEYMVGVLVHTREGLERRLKKGERLSIRVVGMFVIRPNNPGPGAHVANASYVVRADVRGIGLGRQMGEASLELAAELGYSAMQFNTVVSTNSNAVHLWRALGFRIVGTVPDDFRLPDGSTVPHYVMYRSLA